MQENSKYETVIKFSSKCMAQSTTGQISVTIVYKNCANLYISNIILITKSPSYQACTVPFNDHIFFHL